MAKTMGFPKDVYSAKIYTIFPKKCRMILQNIMIHPYSSDFFQLAFPKPNFFLFCFYELHIYKFLVLERKCLRPCWPDQLNNLVQTTGHVFRNFTLTVLLSGAQHDAATERLTTEYPGDRVPKLKDTDTKLCTSDSVCCAYKNKKMRQDAFQV